MIYFYKIRICYFKNDERILKDYIVSFCEILGFLNSIADKHSHFEIYWIKPYYTHDIIFSKRNIN